MLNQLRMWQWLQMQEGSRPAAASGRRMIVQDDDVHAASMWHHFRWTG